MGRGAGCWVMGTGAPHHTSRVEREKFRLCTEGGDASVCAFCLDRGELPCNHFQGRARVHKEDVGTALPQPRCVQLG